MRTVKVFVSTIVLIVLLTITGSAQFSINSAGVNYTLNFDETFPGVILDSIAGTGFTPTPASRQFDSDAWAATGWSDGPMNFGDTKTSGDYARGIATSVVITGGFYAFKISAGNFIFGIQPGGGDWAPGTLTLRLINNTGQNLASISVSYNIYVRNDQPRANSFNFSHSSDNSSYTAVGTLDYTSPATATGTDWIIVPKSTTITGLNINPGAYYYIRWNGADVSGSGSRDEFGLDDVVISAEASTAVANPISFDAVTFSTTQIDLSWIQNGNGDDVMVAWNSSNAFGTPTGTYVATDPISGGGTVIYNGPATSFNHTGLTAGLHYFYKAWSVDGSNIYSSGVVDSAYTQFLEPSNHPTGIAATTNGPIAITVSWTDSDAAHYLLKGSTTGYGSITAPTDGVYESDAALVKNVNAAVQQHQFTQLTPGTQYYFKIFPYNGTGSATNYKTDGTIPEATATTDDLDIDLIISEVADPRDSSQAKFVELYNAGASTIDFSVDPVYICRQANGVPTSWASILLTGTLSAGEEMVLAYVQSSADSNRFDNAYGFEADYYSINISGNGDDGYYLSYGGNQATGYVFDAFGVINVDGTGETWEYTDKKAVRKRSVSAPNPTWTGSEWVILADTATHKDMTPGFHKGDVSWQGSASSNWNEKGTNWNSPNGYIPDASCNVTIPNVTLYPIVNRPGAVNELQIQSGSVLSISPTGSLLIAGP